MFANLSELIDCVKSVAWVTLGVLVFAVLAKEEPEAPKEQDDGPE